MHRVIDQQLMDKHQDEWRTAPSSLSGSSRAHSGQSSRRAHRISDRDRRLFSFFKKNWALLDWPWAQQTDKRQTRRGRRREWHHSKGVTTQPKTGSGTHTEVWGGGHFCTLSVPLFFSLLFHWWLLSMRNRNIRIGLPQRLWPPPLS